MSQTTDTLEKQESHLFETTVRRTVDRQIDHAKIDRVRRMIESGYYDQPCVIDQAIDRMVADMGE
ncbi:MAG: hypothetical protein AAGH99_08035 [Planctomycetota bacterium]